MQHSISVIIPAYRAERFILRAVRSVLAQTIRVGDVVIGADDGVDYARLLWDQGLCDSRVRCVFTDGIATGPGRARNAALAAAKGRIVASLDADDCLAANALQVLAPLARRHGAAYSRARVVDDETGDVLESFDRPLPTGPVALREILASQIHTYAGIVFDRERVTARWPDWMERWEDVYFFVRCFDELDHIYHVAEPLYTYHRIAGSICNRPDTGREYLTWAEELTRRIETGETLELGNAASRQTFGWFLRIRRALESDFIRAQAAGAAESFQSFTRLRLDALDQAPSLAAG